MNEQERLKTVIKQIKFHKNIKTQKEIANILGCNYTYLSDMINGKITITGGFIHKLSQSFGVNPDYIPKGIEPIFYKDVTFEEMIGENVQQITGDNNTSIAGNSNQINSSPALELAINEISEMRKIIQEQVKNNQEQFERFMAVIEKLTLK